MDPKEFVAKVDERYLNQFSPDRQGPVALAIGAYQAGDLDLAKFNQLLETLEGKAREAGCQIKKGYFQIVGEVVKEISGGNQTP